MDSLKAQLQSYYGWDNDKVDGLVREYEKFLIIRSQCEQCSPSEEIDYVWHQHILNTKHYYDYCFDKFNKIIHHDPQMADDQAARIGRLYNTCDKYWNKYGYSPPDYIWKLEELIGKINWNK